MPERPKGLGKGMLEVTRGERKARELLRPAECLCRGAALCLVLKSMCSTFELEFQRGLSLVGNIAGLCARLPGVGVGVEELCLEYGDGKARLGV